jgi:eukaryotic-like serine/threonine-protein kinase
MDPQPNTAAEQPASLNDVLLAYFKDVEAGRKPDREELLARHPLLAGDLAALLDAQERLSALLEPLRATSPARPDTSAAPPDSFGDYEIEGEVGRGGMGVVYKARQVKLDRVVALKMIRSAGLADAEERARFEAEARAGARLQHPNIVQVFEVGEHRGMPFLALEFVAGGNLADQVRGVPWEARRAAEMVERLARAVRHAHEQGVVHRDLKPSNVLLTAKGEPKVADFGLAKRIDADADLTRTHSIRGTPSYMAPEQAAGQTREIGPAADVWALGALLYELLTGRPPFRGATVLDTLEQVRTDDPVPPSRLVGRLPRDLETICLKCLHKEPQRRYASAAAVAEDLESWRDGKPIRARRSGVLERAVKWVRRHPSLAALVGVSTAAVLSLLIGGLHFNARLWDERNRAVEQEQAAQHEKTEAQRLLGELQASDGRLREQLKQSRNALFGAQLARAALLWDKDPDEGLRVLRDKRLCPPEMRDFAWRHYYHLCKRDRTLPGTGQSVAVAFSPDGKTLALGGYQADPKANGPVAGQVRLVDAGSGRERALLTGHTKTVAALAFTPDGQTLASGSNDGTVILWDLAARRPRRSFRAYRDDVVGHLAFTADGGLLLALDLFKEEPRLFDAAGTEVPFPFTMPDDVTDAALSPDGRLLALALRGPKQGGVVQLWDLASGKELRTLRCRQSFLMCLAFSPDGGTLAGGTFHHGAIPLWDVKSGRERLTLWGGSSDVLRLTFTADGKTLLANHGDSVKLWDVDAGTVRLVVRDVDGWDPAALAFSGDGRTLAAYRSRPRGKEAVTLWDLDRRPHALSLSVSSSIDGDVLGLASGGDLLVSASGGDVRLWDLNTGANRRLVGAEDSWRPEIVAATPDGQTVAVCGCPRGPATKPPPAPNTEVKLYRPATGQELASFRWDGFFPEGLALSPDGRFLAASLRKLVRVAGKDETGWEYRFTLLDVASGTELLGRPVIAEALVFGEDGKTLLTYGRKPLDPNNKEVTLWEVPTGRRLASFAGRGADQPQCARQSPDGKVLALGCPGGVVRLCGVPEGPELGRLQGHAHRVCAVAFSPDMKTLASGDEGGVVKLWDVDSGQERASLTGNTGRVTLLVFARQGTRLIAGDSDGEVRVWEPPLPSDAGPNR